MEMNEAVKSLSALAQGSRLAIFRLLVEAGPGGMPAGSIGVKLDLPPATLSFHLAGLTRAGLADSRQDGRFVIYSANFPNMNQLVAYLTENCCGGASCAPAVCKPATTKGEQHETPTRARRRA
jgi:ArsR family transcriptional regulator, arsenate/arsenite/antimonite-responsive transcriptional repressor